jgi:hypothetical protein
VKRERAGEKKNQATTRLVSGRYTKPQTISAAIACGNPKALDVYVREALFAQIDALAERIGSGEQEPVPTLIDRTSKPMNASTSARETTLPGVGVGRTLTEERG